MLMKAKNGQYKSIVDQDLKLSVKVNIQTPIVSVYVTRDHILIPCNKLEVVDKVDSQLLFALFYEIIQDKEMCLCTYLRMNKSRQKTQLKG